MQSETHGRKNSTQKLSLLFLQLLDGLQKSLKSAEI